MSERDAEHPRAFDELFTIGDASDGAQVPALPYCARWHTRPTAIGIAKLAVQLMASRPLPFFLVIAIAIAVRLLSDAFGAFLFGASHPELESLVYTIFGLDTLPHRVISPFSEGLVLLLAASTYLGPSHSVRSWLRSSPVMLLNYFIACVLSRLIGEISVFMLVIPAFLITGRLAFVTPNIVFERMGVIAAFNESWSRTRPFHWLLVRLTLLYVGVSVALILVIETTAELAFNATPATLEVLEAVIEAPLSVCATVVFVWMYFERRMGWLLPEKDRDGNVAKVR